MSLMAHHDTDLSVAGRLNLGAGVPANGSECLKNTPRRMHRYGVESAPEQPNHLVADARPDGNQIAEAGFLHRLRARQLVAVPSGDDDGPPWKGDVAEFSTGNWRVSRYGEFERYF